MTVLRKFTQWLCLALFTLLLISCSGQLNDTTTITNDTNNQAAETNISDSTLSVHYIDVGQGDCTLVLCDGQSLLIDAGNNSKGTAIQLYLEKQGVKTLDYVIGTHPDADHIGGLDVVLYKFNCKTVILPDSEKDTRTYDDVLQTMQQKNYKNTLPEIGTTYSVGDASFEIITPSQEYGKNANNASVGIVLSHGNNQFIFTGDAEEESEYNMLRSNENIGADVYKVSHHGSKSATSIEFLDRVNPQYAVISCGDDNSYGHPHEQTLDRLHSKNISLFRTDEQGDIIASSDGTDITWNCQPSDLWTAGEGNRSDNESITQTTEQDQPNIIPADTTYVINTNTRKFHAPTCSSIKDMSAQNRLNSTQTREEIINQDYSPCGRCHP